MSAYVRFRFAAAIAATLVLAAGVRVFGATTTATLTVTANVAAECTATSSTLAFGSYSALISTNIDAQATFTVACTQGTTATVGLDLGGHSSAGLRRMADSGNSNFIPYELYTDTGRTTVWGNASGSWVSLSAAPSNAPRSLIVYGRTVNGLNVPVGGYSDAVTITVTF